MAPAQSSARPPVTTSVEEPSDDRPAVKANGTVRPSDRPMILCQGISVNPRISIGTTHTSRTISGEMRCLSSSPLRSLQQVPRSWTPHLDVSGASLLSISSSCCCLVKVLLPVLTPPCEAPSSEAGFSVQTVWPFPPVLSPSSVVWLFFLGRGTAGPDEAEALEEDPAWPLPPQHFPPAFPPQHAMSFCVMRRGSGLGFQVRMARCVNKAVTEKEELTDLRVLISSQSLRQSLLLA